MHATLRSVNVNVAIQNKSRAALTPSPSPRPDNACRSSNIGSPARGSSPGPPTGRLARRFSFVIEAVIRACKLGASPPAAVGGRRTLAGLASARRSLRVFVVLIYRPVSTLVVIVFVPTGRRSCCPAPSLPRRRDLRRRRRTDAIGIVIGIVIAALGRGGCGAAGRLPQAPLALTPAAGRASCPKRKRRDARGLVCGRQ